MPPNRTFRVTVAFTAWGIDGQEVIDVVAYEPMGAIGRAISTVGHDLIDLGAASDGGWLKSGGDVSMLMVTALEAL